MEYASRIGYFSTIERHKRR